MRLLIVDSLRRLKWMYLSFCVYFLGFGSINQNIGIGLMVGTMFAPGFNKREILVLPVTRRQIWRARWVLAFVPVFVRAAFRLGVLGIGQVASLKPGVTVSWILISSLFQIVYIGTLLAASIPGSYYLPRIVAPPKSFLIGGVLLISAAIADGLIENRLPRQWHELSSVTIVLFAVGLCFTVMAFFHSPKIGARRIVAMADVDKRPGRTPHTEKVRLRDSYMATGIAGLTLFAWCQIRVILVAAITCGIVSQLPLILSDWLPNHRPSPIDRGVTIFSPTDPLGVVIQFALPLIFSWIGMLLAPEILSTRRLRTLPLSTRSLAWIWTLIPLLFWLTFWVFPVAAYGIMSGHFPPTFRLDLLGEMAGLACLLGAGAALQKPVEGRSRLVMISVSAFTGIVAAGLLVLYFLHSESMSSATASVLQSLAGAAGWICVAISFLLNRRAFRRNHSLYVSKIPIRGLTPARWVSQ